MTDLDTLRPYLATALASTDFPDLGRKVAGKVRDVYLQEGMRRRILIATDRQSAFDRFWCTIPLKGQVLNLLSAWWFEKVQDLMPTHILATPDPNVMVVKELRMVPVEIVVRGYLTGSTKTSAWVNYEKGVRLFCGNRLPDGMVKNQRFLSPIITPTTKAEDDELIDPATILARGLATKTQWEEISEKALQLFMRGQEIASKRGLILVDTKYEMGMDSDGTLTLADEVHTPDSSRYWIQATYEEHLSRGEEPESLDKEFFRLWLREQGFDPSTSLRAGHGKPAPMVTDEVRLELSKRYIDLFERVTGESFPFPDDPIILRRIQQNTRSYVIRGRVSLG